MSHWTHFITEEDIATPEQWEENECIPVPEGFDKALEEAQERRAQWLEQQKALERLEREARSAELSGLMVCGDDEWARR